MKGAHLPPDPDQQAGAAIPGEEGQPQRPGLSSSRTCPSRGIGTQRVRCSNPECVGGRPCARLAELGLGDDQRPLPRSKWPRCGARTRAGWPCRMRVQPGRRRCRLHGGTSTGRRRPRAGPGSPRRSGGGGRRGEPTPRATTPEILHSWTVKPCPLAQWRKDDANVSTIPWHCVAQWGVAWAMTSQQRL
jgi:hypothetical protein